MRLREIAATVVLLAAAAGALAALAAWAVPDVAVRNVEVFTEMVHSPAFKTQSANPNFEDGLTQRTPPVGTIARGFAPIRFDGADSPVNPYANDPDTAIAVRGAVMYENHCAACHGARGEGDGPVARRGFPPPPSLLAGPAKDLPDAEIFRIITQGRGNMPGLAAQISRDDRWKTIRSVRNLQGVAP